MTQEFEACKIVTSLNKMGTARSWRDPSTRCRILI